MRDLRPELLPRLLSHRLSGLDTGPEAAYPFYAGYSLVNLPASICHWFGIPPFGAPPLGQEILNLYRSEFQHIVFLVVDGMGLNTLEQSFELAKTDSSYAVWTEIAQAGALTPLTSIVPSTTAAALTTFWTGCPPAAHGIVGYEVWLKEYGLIANMILHMPASYTGDVGSLRKSSFDPLTFLPVPTLGPHLAQHGIRARAYQHQAIAYSGLSTMLLPGVEIFPFRNLSDLWVTLDNVLNASSNQRTYNYIYWGDLDELSHRFGPQDPRAALELSAFSRQLSYFIRQRQARGRASTGGNPPGSTLLLITADHGHISTPRHPEYELRNHPGFLDCLVMVPSGEARLPFAYLRPGREGDFLQYIEKTWPGQFKAIPSAQAIQAGLFGGPPVYSRLADRVGDYIMIPQDGAYWWFGNRDNPLLGRHGGMSRVEMTVPLLAVEL